MLQVGVQNGESVVTGNLARCVEMYQVFSFRSASLFLVTILEKYYLYPQRELFKDTH